MGFGRVFLFIFIFALLEAVVLGQVAQSIGSVTTILLTVFTAMLGSLLFRWQGLESWIRLNKRMQQGEMPGAELVEGVMLLLGGALLITPGFITDAIGFLLLLPGSRKALANYMVKQGMMQAFAQRSSAGFSQGPSPGGPGQGNVHFRTWVYRQGGSAQSPFEPNATQTGSNGYGGSSDDAPKVYDDGAGHLIIEGESEQKKDK